MESVHKGCALHGLHVIAAQGDGSSRAITGSDFFRRHPALHPALLAHLATAVERLKAGDAGHPSLFPVLALLARLRCRPMNSERKMQGSGKSFPQCHRVLLDDTAKSDTADTSLSDIDKSSVSSVVPSNCGALSDSPKTQISKLCCWLPSSAMTTSHLSRRPSARSSDMVVVSAEDPAAFLPLVRRCAGAAPMAVRRLAAQALSPLVTAEGAPGLVRELAQSLPQAGEPVRHNEVRDV